jgi:hypothetical protein
MKIGTDLQAYLDAFAKQQIPEAQTIKLAEIYNVPVSNESIVRNFT